jgi:spore coat polysaccharide biosynthesis predicted glycosyltransferase SpsG
MKIAIITDGDNTIGMGHVYQSVTLAGELSKHIDDRSKIFFLTKSDRIVTDLLSESGFDVYQYPDDNSILNALTSEEPDRIIFDKLDVAPVFARQIKETIGGKLIIFTNLTTANQYADITVLADIGSNFKNVCEKDAISGAIHFYGPKYWMLRPEFFVYGKRKKNPLSNVRNIMLIFGGADQSNLTSLVLNELLSMVGSTFEIMSVVGAAFKNHEELKAVIEQNRITQSKCQIVHNLKDVAEAMHRSDVVFASPGLSFFEALAVGTPVVGFHQNELQRDVYKGYLTTLDKSELFRLSSIIENKSFIFPDDPFVVSMEIGKGKDEVIQEILK